VLLAALLCACAVAAAACGGSSDDAASEATTAPAPAPAPTAPAGDLVALLPPPDAVSGLRPGAARALPTAQAFVDALYQIGDPARDAAERRLEEGGYADGVLRDQAGEDPEGGAALVRSYVITMGDEAAAREEVDAAADEVADSSLGEGTEVEVPEVEGARALRVEVSQGGVSGSVIFVTFPGGAEVYGIQAVARAGADLPEDEVVQAAQDLAERVAAGP
jgi:hypothetical protein